MKTKSLSPTELAKLVERRVLMLSDCWWMQRSLPGKEGKLKVSPRMENALATATGGYTAVEISAPMKLMRIKWNHVVMARWWSHKGKSCFGHHSEHQMILYSKMCSQERDFLGVLPSHRSYLEWSSWACFLICKRRRGVLILANTLIFTDLFTHCLTPY